MGSISERNVSLWVANTRDAGFPILDHDVETDVAIVGAGITGLTAARLLSEAGVRVAVLEAREVCAVDAARRNSPGLLVEIPHPGGG
jgi:ribulose 1,5-bisphosphate synthetase/thiazole synthase